MRLEDVIRPDFEGRQSCQRSTHAKPQRHAERLPFEPADNAVLHHTVLGPRLRSREWVTEKLADWHDLHDELLRTGRALDRMDAREVRTLVIELGFVASVVWPVEPVPEAKPSNVTFLALPDRWAVVPFDGEVA